MIKFAVIGQGHIGKRHAEMIRRNPDSELVAVCDVLPKEQTGCENIEVPYFSSIDELLNAGLDIDVVNICTPNGFHADYAIKALEAKKHVVLEKPAALTKADAERILFKSLEVSRHVFCVMQNRYSPPSVWLKEVMTNRILGDIYMVKLDCYWNRDSGVVTFDFINGGMGCLNYSTSVWDTNLESSLTVIGERGTIKVAGQYMNEVAYCHVKDYEMPTLAPSNPPNDYGLYKGSAQNHHYVIQNVVEKLTDKGSITTNLLEGLKVVDIIERIYQVRDKQWKKTKQ